MIDLCSRGARGFSVLVAAASGASACEAAPGEPASHVGSASTSESANCTVIADPSGTIVDASGNSWALVGSGVGSFTVNENGAPAGYTAVVTQIVYVNHTVWQQNAAGGWWFWQGGTWVFGADPTTACTASESASCTSLTGTSGTITDSTGNAWALASSATDGLVVDENGAPAGYSAQVTELAYVNQLVWQQNAAGGWWSWQSGNWFAGSDPTTSCSGTADGGAPANPVGGGVGSNGSPPPPAAAAGYNTLTLGPSVTALVRTGLRTATTARPSTPRRTAMAA